MDKTAIRERPIIFSGEMVHAISEGKKTQTRRVIKPPPTVAFIEQAGVVLTEARWKKLEPYRILGHVWPNFNLWGDFMAGCPYGQIGNRLWIRETWQCLDGCLFYAADERSEVEDWPDGLWNVDKWRPSIFMPRWASRITLEITDTRVERLQEIGENDAIAESVTPEPGKHHLSAFVRLWDSINAKRGLDWEANPWVWVITFKKT